MPLPHPSGASTWLNVEAKERPARALAELGVQAATLRADKKGV